MPVLSSLSGHEVNDIAQAAVGPRHALRNGAPFNDWILPTALDRAGLRQSSGFGPALFAV
jgi:hypothetical protein